MKKLLVIICLLLLVSLFGCKSKFNDDNLCFDTKTEEYDESINYINKFYYNQLDSYEQTIYKSIYHACINNLDSIEIGLTYDFDKVCYAINSFCYDWPQYYWYSVCDIYDNKNYITLVPTYVTDDINPYELSFTLENFALDILSKCKSDSDYETIKNIHDFLINNVTYKTDSLYNEDIRSVFLYGETDCSGFAYVFQYLCNLASIECYSVYGTALPEDGLLHQWNMLKLNNKYYYVDVTWDDGKDEDGNKDTILYEYFLANDSIMSVDHKLTDEYTYPTCNDDSYYYYNMPGVFLSSFDEELLTNLIVNWINDGYNHFYFKCSDYNTYLDSINYLYYDEGFLDIYHNYISYYYDLTYGVTSNDDACYFEFYYENN